MSSSATRPSSIARGFVLCGGRAALAALAVLAGCAGDGDGPTAPQPQTINFGPFELAAGAESFGDCISATLDNSEPLYVNTVELVTGSGFHHSNWFWVPESTFPGPDGIWNCDSRSYDEVVAGAAGGVLYAQSTQAVAETQTFPPGVVITIPPHAKIVAGIHTLNASDATLTTSLALTLTPISLEDVTVRLAAIAMDFRQLALPAQRRSDFSIECDLADLHQRVVGTPIDFSVFYALPHYHGLGRGFELVATGGPGGDVVIASSDGTIGEPLAKSIDPAFSLEGFQGLRFTCRFDNQTDSVVRWGLGDGEMCTFQGFTDSIYKWGGRTVPSGTSTSVDDGEVVHVTRPCEAFAFPAVDP